jgi:hypothetical protein
METKDDHDFSDLEVEQVRAVVREELGLEEPGWVLLDAIRRSGQRDVIDVSVQNVADERLLKVVLPRQEFEGENPANSSRLTDTVFNISIRLMEFMAIRGLDEFENGAATTLEIYPKDPRQPTATEPIAKGDWVAKAPLRPKDS